MPRIGDALGAAYVHCWNNGRGLQETYEVLEMDSGHLHVGDVRRYFTSPEHFSELERWALTQASGTVADVGCGAGRFGLALQNMPSVQQVIGIDNSPGAVEVATERGLNAMVQDIRHLDTDANFDSLFLGGNNLGLLGSRTDAHAVLDRLAGLVRTGGRLIAFSGLPDLVDPDTRTINRIHGEFDGLMHMRVRYAAQATPWFNFTFFSPGDLQALTSSVQWAITDIRVGSGSWVSILVRS